MADAVRKATSLVLLYFFLLPCLTNDSAALAARILSGKGPWCVARLGSTVEEQLAAIQYACGGGIADCSAIQEGGSCYSPDPGRQSSYAMNAYYYAAGHKDINCDFNGAGLIAYTDPSYLNCNYPS